ncbi:MAG: hypothetical protein AAB538_05015 [Patescibacteria group bacterium]
MNTPFPQQTLLTDILTILGADEETQMKIVQDLQELALNETVVILLKNLSEVERAKFRHDYESKNAAAIARVLEKNVPRDEFEKLLFDNGQKILKDYLKTMTADITDERRQKIVDLLQKYDSSR